MNLLLVADLPYRLTVGPAPGKPSWWPLQISDGDTLTVEWDGQPATVRIARAGLELRDAAGDHVWSLPWGRVHNNVGADASAMVAPNRLLLSPGAAVGTSLRMELVTVVDLHRGREVFTIDQGDRFRELHPVAVVGDEVLARAGTVEETWTVALNLATRRMDPCVDQAGVIRGALGDLVWTDTEVRRWRGCDRASEPVGKLGTGGVARLDRSGTGYTALLDSGATLALDASFRPVGVAELRPGHDLLALADGGRWAALATTSAQVAILDARLGGITAIVPGSSSNRGLAFVPGSTVLFLDGPPETRWFDVAARSFVGPPAFPDTWPTLGDDLPVIEAPARCLREACPDLDTDLPILALAALPTVQPDPSFQRVDVPGEGCWVRRFRTEEPRVDRPEPMEHWDGSGRGGFLVNYRTRAVSTSDGILGAQGARLLLFPHGRELRAPGTAPIRGLAAAADGRTIAVQTDEGLRVWTLPAGERE